jgi:hypothetical protein
MDLVERVRRRAERRHVVLAVQGIYELMLLVMRTRITATSLEVIGVRRAVVV